MTTQKPEVLVDPKMDEIRNKLNLLSKIAKELNHINVTWAIGASMMLYFKGIISDFYDIDIMVTEEEIDEVKEVLLSLGIIQAPNPTLTYKTKHFMEFIIESVEIDVIAGFVIVNKDEKYHFPLKKEHIKEFTVINGVRIPLHALEGWRTYYQLMGRVEKVKLIDAWKNRT